VHGASLYAVTPAHGCLLSVLKGRGGGIGHIQG
jgi:hypothetical protein